MANLALQWFCLLQCFALADARNVFPEAASLIQHVRIPGEISSFMASEQNHGDVQLEDFQARKIASCPVEEKHFSVQPAANDDPRSNGITRIAMASFPTSGSSWFRMMIAIISARHGVGNPMGSVYEQEYPDSASLDNAYVNKDWNRTAGVVALKTHYPSNEESFSDDERILNMYKASMHFDKAMVLVRNPHQVVRSNLGRWNNSDCYASAACLANNIVCWANWWDSVTANLPETHVHFVKFEELCQDPIEELKKAFDFLGGTFSTVTRAEIKGYFESEVNGVDSCIYSQNDLAEQAQQLNLETGENVNTTTLAPLFQSSALLSRFYG